tara:strand:- start:314 stop:1093 length:780 start_codon:yes stop_codon:yes gene_type:complete
MRIETQEMLTKLAPAALGHRPDDRVSDRYSMVPTNKIVDLLEGEGWNLVEARQVKSRTWEPLTAKHHLSFSHERLSREDLAVNDSVPRLELINAHNGLGTYKLMAGIFRLVCSNGLVVSERDFGQVKLRHIGFSEDEVIKASEAIIHNVSRLSDVVDSWQGIMLSDDEKRAFAEEASTIRWNDKDTANDMVEDILRPRRQQDMGNDVWTVYNVVQENIIKGGFTNSNTGRKARAVKHIDKTISYNQELWDLAHGYAAAN